MIPGAGCPNRGTRRAAVRRLAVALLLVFITAGGALAQVGVGVSIPEASSLTISHASVTFDLSVGTYPPSEFPAYYAPTLSEPVSDQMSITVFTNLDNWTVEVSFTGLYNETDNVILPASQLEYSLNGGLNWHQFSQGSNTIIVGSGPTVTYDTRSFEVRFRVDGSETPGVYLGTLTYTLVSH